MRLLTVGTRDGPLATATKIAMDKGASAIHADCIGAVMAMLRSDSAADLLIVDVAIDVRGLVLRIEAGRIHVPVVACGTHNDADAAIAAIDAGAKEYIPLPPDPEIIAAILAAVADDTRAPSPCPPPQAGPGLSICPPRLDPRPSLPRLRGRVREGEGRDAEAMAKVARAALAADTVTRALVGRTVADVERDLILETLKHCLGNRTRAANILGISIRTLRNKLNEYAADGVRVPPSSHGELRGAA
jgi:DNA-binding NtrC family response regulator